MRTGRIDWQAEAERLVKQSSTEWCEDHRGVATWDDEGSPISDDEGSTISIAFGNDGYSEDKRSQVEVGVLRRFLHAKRIAELGFATSEDGYSWAMIVESGDSDLMRDVLGKAWMLASDTLERQDQPDDVTGDVEEVWMLISLELDL